MNGNFFIEHESKQMANIETEIMQSRGKNTIYAFARCESTFFPRLSSTQCSKERKIDMHLHLTARDWNFLKKLEIWIGSRTGLVSVWRRSPGIISTPFFFFFLNFSNEINTIFIASKRMTRWFLNLMKIIFAWKWNQMDINNKVKPWPMYGTMEMKR